MPDDPSDILDLRDLEAPEPMHRILLAVRDLAPGQSMRAHTPRVPMPLLPRLAQRGLVCEVQVQPDGSAILQIRRP